jgi:SAM-dependent MidA family methyltransferase
MDELKFPQPNLEQLTLSQELKKYIQNTIENEGGWIPFSRYMELALYSPMLGYYTNSYPKIGKEGDFTTAPEISPLFGQTLAEEFARILPHTACHILELGAGTGQLAYDILEALAKKNLYPNYTILELSPNLRHLQQEKLAPFRNRIKWLDQLPKKIEGIVLANEVLDAIPCELIEWQQEGLKLKGLNQQLDWESRKPPEHVLDYLPCSRSMPIGSISEIQPAACGLVRSIGELMHHGACFWIDYGFPTKEYYHPERTLGTLKVHYRHHSMDDPLFLPGLCDITTHVDFSKIAEHGLAAGLECYGYTSQAQFLLNCGFLELMSRTDDPETTSIRHIEYQHQAHILLAPQEMGELFKVLILGKGLSNAPWRASIERDRTHLL